MSNDPSFIDRVLDGSVLTFEIDNFVRTWHEGDSLKELHEFLGFTEEEYDLWVDSPDFLELIIYSRVSQTPLAEIANDNFMEKDRVAARADEVWVVDRLKQWILKHSS